MRASSRVDPRGAIARRHSSRALTVCARPASVALLSGSRRVVPRVSFTPNLQRHVELPPREVAGASVRELLDAVFEQEPRARGYVVDERGALRAHMNVFVDGTPIKDRVGLSDAVGARGEVYVMQALSGG